MKETKTWIQKHPKRLFIIVLVICLGGSAGIYRQYANEPKKDAVLLEILAKLPQEGLVEDSLEHHAWPQVFGYSEFASLYTAAYMNNGKRIKVFFNKCSSLSEAQSLAKKYHGFVSTNGGKAVDVDAIKFELPVLELYGVTEIIFTNGLFICGIHESEYQDEAVQVAGLLKTSFNPETGWLKKLLP